VLATRYVTPLREGGSLPAVVEADDGACYVMKFAGAGQGPKALIAELVAGEIARTLGLRIPELVLIELEEGLGRNEPNPEIRDLLEASLGLNLGVAFLPSAFAYNQLLKPPPDARLASDIVWFDAYVTNVDRTARNVNILVWQNELWLIDHGAALYFHHDWTNYLERSKTPFGLIQQHTLLPFAAELQASDRRLAAKLSAAELRRIVGLVPEIWLGEEPRFVDGAAHRAAYVDYLLSRLAVSSVFVEEAANARAKLL
jgi:hypothetical protein